MRRSNLLMSGLASRMWVAARTNPAYNGCAETHGWIINHCRFLHEPTGTLLVFTRDEGMHACGWFKNPDFDRCFHLSLSYVDLATHTLLPQNHELSDQWVDHFYGDNRRYLWTESPYSDGGKEHDVWHYRLLCDPSWTPMIPKGEPYSKDQTPAGWKSYSDQRAEREARAKEMAERGLTPPKEAAPLFDSKLVDVEKA